MSAMLTTVKMFVFITHIIYTHGERTRFCDAGTDELFYDNANNFIGTNWTWDNDGEPKNWYYEYSLPSHAADDFCYTESCYAFYAVDFVIDALITNPSFTSVPISTIDHWNIYIIFSVATYQIGSTTGSCVTSYTVNNGDDFDEIHSQPTLIARTTLFYPNITRALGTNAENINNLQIKLWIMDTETDPKVGENIQCIYDEILICGTTITPAPTSMTLSPTSNTASPTSNTALPTSNTALPTSNTGSPSQTPTSNTLPPSVSPTSDHSDESSSGESESSDEIQMYGKQQDQNYIFDDTNNHNVYKEKIITISLSSSNVINVMALFILFGCVGAVICVYYNNN